MQHTVRLRIITERGQAPAPVQSLLPRHTSTRALRHNNTVMDHD
jgi:hypothetical protein